MVFGPKFFGPFLTCYLVHYFFFCGLLYFCTAQQSGSLFVTVLVTLSFLAFVL